MKEMELEAQIQDLMHDNDEAMMMIDEGEKQNFQLNSRLSGIQLNLVTFNDGEAFKESPSVSNDGLSLIGEEQQGDKPLLPNLPFDNLAAQSEISRSQYNVYTERDTATNNQESYDRGQQKFTF